MHTIRSILLITLFSFIPMVVSAEWSVDPTSGNPICSAAGDQSNALILPDGEGGAFVVWRDDRVGTHVYAQRIDAGGEPQWAPEGVRVCTYDSDQQATGIATDMAGGVIVVFTDVDGDDYNIYSQRLGPDGTHLWASIGNPVCNFDGHQSGADVASDGQGGVVVCWFDDRDAGEDVYAQRLDASGDMLWPFAGVPVCTEAGQQVGARIVSDQGGGATIVWYDNRGGVFDVYARRINYLGTPIWDEGGTLVASRAYLPWIVNDDSQGYLIGFYGEGAAPGPPAVRVQRMLANGVALWGDEGIAFGADDLDTGFPQQVVADGAGGVFLSWLVSPGDDRDLRAQHVDEDGTLSWGFSGRLICGAEGDQYPRFLLPDGEGGVLIGWEDQRLGNLSIYAQRLDAFGNELWNEDGNVVAMGTVAGHSVACRDDRGGLITAYSAWSGTEADLHAMRLDGTGYLGEPAPRLETVTDVPDDQGGAVTLHWAAGYVDAMPWHAVANYSVWMRAPEVKSAASSVDVSRLSEELGSVPEVITSLAAAGWTYVTMLPSTLSEDYGCPAPTYGDSTATELPLTMFRVVAHGVDPWVIWESTPWIGWSVDNLVPGAPQLLTGEWAAPDEVSLTWSVTGDSDVAGYRVYRGAVTGFELNAGSLIGETGDVVFLDAVPTGEAYYRVTAVDVHDNEGPGSNEAHMTPTTGVEAASEAFALHSNRPNPFNPVTTIRFDLPVDAHVDLGVFAVDGTRVATLRSGVLTAGRHDVLWGGDDDEGRAQPSGVYVVRLESEDFRQVRRMTLLR